MSHNTTVQNRLTGSFIQVATCKDLDIEGDGDNWSTVCTDHGSIVTSRTLSLALKARAFPEWCEKCLEGNVKMQKLFGDRLFSDLY